MEKLNFSDVEMEAIEKLFKKHNIICKVENENQFMVLRYVI